MEKTTENSRRKDTKGIDEVKLSKGEKGINDNTMMTEDFHTEKYSNTKKLEKKLIQERLMTTLHHSPQPK